MGHLHLWDARRSHRSWPLHLMGIHLNHHLGIRHTLGILPIHRKVTALITTPTTRRRHQRVLRNLPVRP